eukprot:scaffold230482_cov28-Prasinocladus_malaysianus.AAC.2
MKSAPASSAGPLVQRLNFHRQPPTAALRQGRRQVPSVYRRILPWPPAPPHEGPLAEQPRPR